MKAFDDRSANYVIAFTQPHMNAHRFLWPIPGFNDEYKIHLMDLRVEKENCALTVGGSDVGIKEAYSLRDADGGSIWHSNWFQHNTADANAPYMASVPIHHFDTWYSDSRGKRPGEFILVSRMIQLLYQQIHGFATYGEVHGYKETGLQQAHTLRMDGCSRLLQKIFDALYREFGVNVNLDATDPMAVKSTFMFKTVTKEHL